MPSLEVVVAVIIVGLSILFILWKRGGRQDAEEPSKRCVVAFCYFGLASWSFVCSVTGRSINRPVDPEVDVPSGCQSNCLVRLLVNGPAA